MVDRCRVKAYTVATPNPNPNPIFEGKPIWISLFKRLTCPITCARVPEGSNKRSHTDG